jgi:crotonobetainyl-CoA:carnitine CoA-transferase CaiB-like acyl-CoA transferase
VGRVPPSAGSTGSPAGPYGTITDSLAPRFVAAGLAAGLLYHRRTGRGCYLDLAQVEAGIYTLSAAILDGAVNGHVVTRNGNRHEAAVPHGAFRCADTPGDGAGDGGGNEPGDGPRRTIGDRWVAVACWDDDQWARLAAEIGGAALDPALVTLAGRHSRIDEVEALVDGFTAPHQALAVAERLQSLGIEAVPVQDFRDCFHDPQLAVRRHLVALTHPYLGEGRYERNGFRLSDADAPEAGYWRAGPTLGQDNDWMLSQLGYSPDEITHLAEIGALD